MYLFIGGLTTLVGLGSYWLVTRTFLDPGVPLQLQAANCISWVLAVAFAYVTNRIFVFRRAKVFNCINCPRRGKDEKGSYAFAA